MKLRQLSLRGVRLLDARVELPDLLVGAFNSFFSLLIDRNVEGQRNDHGSEDGQDAH